MALTVRRPYLVVAGLALALVLVAVWSPKAQGAMAQTGAQVAAQGLPPYLNLFQWRSIGPDRGGRSLASSGVKGRPNEAYFGAVGGGLWKTTDKGETWAPVTDGQITSSSVGALAVSDSNPDIVFIGTGESCIRGNIMSGDGVYKSADAGKTWTHVGFRDAKNISKIRIHPTNPDIVYVAAFGHHGAPNEERGVFKSIDGGKTWKRTLFRDGKTAAVDLSIDPKNPLVMYAAMWEAYRTEYTMASGGPGSGLFKSVDGGDTWTEVTRAPGMPTGLIGRIGVAVSPADSNRVYALVENENGGLFRSDDAGKSWKLVNTNRNIRQRAFYYTHVTADPKNADTVYLLNVSAYKSTDGGTTLTSMGGGTHSDYHDLWVDSDDPAHMVVANDGGGAVTFAGGQGWTAQDFPTPQYYHIVTTAHVPYHVCGAQQDGSTVCLPNETGGGGGRGGGGRGGAAAPVMYSPGGAEDGAIAPDPKDPDVFFSGSNNGGFMDYVNRRTGQRREVHPYPRMFSGEPSSALVERVQWTYPIVFSPVDPRVLYTATQHVWRTTSNGQNWDRISGDLSRHDPKTLGHSGGAITGDMNGPEVYATVFALAPGKTDVNVLWAGSDDGLIHVTRDGGKTWTNVTPKDMPDFGRVSIIDASAFDAGTAYAAVKKPLLDDFAPYIFRTHDFGKTWTKIVNGLDPEEYVHVVREDPTRRGLLYAGTQTGVRVSWDDGNTWKSLSLNLPNVQVKDLVVEDHDLAIATHGRGFYILDDIAPIRQFTPAVAAASPVYLFAPEVAHRSTNGAMIRYWVTGPVQSLTLDIIDKSGTVVRSFAGAAGGRGAAAPAAGRGGGGGARGGGASMSPGMQSVTWDLRYPSATSFPGMILWGGGVQGPAAAPGTYQVRMTVDGVAQTQPFQVEKHPLHADVTNEDLQAQFDLAIRIRDKTSEANQAVIDIRRIKADIADRLTKSPDAKLKSAAAALVSGLSEVEGEIYQVKNQSGQDPLNFPIKVNNRLASLLSVVNDGDGRPIGNAEPIFNALVGELKVLTDDVNRIITKDLAAVNAELTRLKLEPVKGR
jgi:photosystem II stability/assembly factor-like uncharacterized protein